MSVTLAFDDFVWNGITTACGLLRATRTPSVLPGGSQNVSIGGTIYPMGVLAGYVYRGGAPGFRNLELDFQYGDRVGVYTSRRHESRSTSPRFCTEDFATLVAARVDGVSFGTNPVAVEESPKVAPALMLRAYPVPAAQAVTVEADEAVAVEVVDALGRRVASGEAAPGRSLRLDVSAWPAGVYVARSAGTSGIRTARIVVAR